MASRTDYNKQAVEACFSVLVEIMTVLGEFREHIVLIGGWIPYFLIQNKKDEHTGSLDIDLALDFQKISFQTYHTIFQLLCERGYQQGLQPFIFYREVITPSGKTIKVQIDFLAAEYGGTGASHRTQEVQDLRARKARGCDLVFKEYTAIKISGKMPDGAENEMTIKIANVVAFLVMKGMAIWEGYKEKHAYDIYFIIRHYIGGIDALENEFTPYLKNNLVLEGLEKIRKMFEKLNSPGPVWIANFEGIESIDKRELMQRDAFERVNAFLDRLDIKPFQE